MWRKALAALAMLALSGCVSVIDGMYDDLARKDCEQARDRAGCHDRVEQNRRERDRD
jgi:hypothetical protein